MKIARLGNAQPRQLRNKLGGRLPALAPLTRTHTATSERLELIDTRHTVLDGIPDSACRNFLTAAYDGFGR